MPRTGDVHPPLYYSKVPLSVTEGWMWARSPTENLMKALLKALMQEESGQDLIEYALIAALIALVAIAGLNGLASSINSEFNSIGSDI